MSHFHQASLGFHTRHCRPGAQEHAGNAAVDADVVIVDGNVGVAGDAWAIAAAAHTAFHEGSRQRYTPDAAYAAEGGGAAGHAHMTLREVMLGAVSGRTMV
jgi:hypothetical protein